MPRGGGCPTAEPALVVEVDALGAVTLDAEEGLLDPRDVAILADAFDALAPVLARARAPRLPPRATWPEVWREVWSERMAIAAEGGARDPGAVADLDLRVAVHRGEVEAYAG